MSLIGPRPERPEIEDEILKSIPYYSFRNIFIDNKKLNVTAYLNKYASKELPLKVKINTDRGYINHEINFKPGQLKRNFDIDIPEMRLWSLEDPYLYDVEIKLDDDIVNSYFGMRKISTINLPGTHYPYVSLNNEQINLQLYPYWPKVKT